MRLTPDTKLHSRVHLLADDLARALGELGRFGSYLGVAARYSESDLRGLLRRVLEKSDLPPEARGKYFFAALRGLRPLPRKKKKPTGKKKKTKKDKTPIKKRTPKKHAPHRAASHS